MKCTVRAKIECSGLMLANSYMYIHKVLHLLRMYHRCDRYHALHDGQHVGIYTSHLDQLYHCTKTICALSTYVHVKNALTQYLHVAMSGTGNQYCSCACVCKVLTELLSPACIGYELSITVLKRSPICVQHAASHSL